jgi:hypothetical protein
MVHPTVQYALLPVDAASQTHAVLSRQELVETTQRSLFEPAPHISPIAEENTGAPETEQIFRGFTLSVAVEGPLTEPVSSLDEQAIKAARRGATNA